MGLGKYKLSLIESHMILWKIWNKEWWILLFRAIPMKSVLWVRHRIRRIKNRTSDEEVIKKRRLENLRKMKGHEDDEDDDREMEVKMKEIHALLK